MTVKGKDLRPGDHVFAVHEGWRDEVEIQEAVVARVGAKLTILEGRPGLAFGCRTHHPTTEDFSTTRADAWLRYVAVKEAHLTATRQRVVELEKKVAKLHKRGAP